MRLLDDHYYFLGSRMLSHLGFWLSYYLFFSLLWAEGGDYYRSFGLELVLLPLRMMASYLMIYYFLPKLLLEGKEFAFAMAYVGVIAVAGFLQRVLIYFYYELLFMENPPPLWDMGLIIRAVVLVNTTVLLLSAFKIFQHWKKERSQNRVPQDEPQEIRADKRTYLVRPSEIMYIEGLGNYVNYYLLDGRKLTSHNSLKNLETHLPEAFVRIHKSYIINKQHISSFSYENVEIQGKLIPIGKSATVDFG